MMCGDDVLQCSNYNPTKVHVVERVANISCAMHVMAQLPPAYLPPSFLQPLPILTIRDLLTQ